MSYELDYNDQCDIAYGRIKRTLESTRECDHVGDLDDVAGFSLKGLGLSGEQASMAFDQAKGELDGRAELRGIIDELDKALTAISIEPRGMVEACRTRDLPDRLDRLLKSRDATESQRQAVADHRDQLKVEHRELQESVEDSWCVIANASDWDMPGREEWREAAERWRDRYNTNATPRAMAAEKDPGA